MCNGVTVTCALWYGLYNTVLTDFFLLQALSICARRDVQLLWFYSVPYVSYFVSSISNCCLLSDGVP